MSSADVSTPGAPSTVFFDFFGAVPSSSSSSSSSFSSSSSSSLLSSLSSSAPSPSPKASSSGSLSCMNEKNSGSAALRRSSCALCLRARVERKR